MSISSKKRELQKLLNDGKTLFLDEKNTRIGVGKTRPQATLHVGGDLTVDGAINFTSDAATTTQDFTGTDPYGFLADGDVKGEIIKIGSATTTAGKLYFLTDSAAWTTADADASTTGGPSLLAIAVGTNSGTDGMLLKGYARVASSILASTATAKQGDAVYISTTAGELTFTAPSGSGDIVRIVGYLLTPVNSNTDSIIYFRPDHTWVEIS